MLHEGSQAPSFEISLNNSEKITLNKLKGKKVVLYFYPKADTPGCTIESKDFADHQKEFEKNNCIIIGISRDSIKKNNAFSEKLCLPFPLGCDENGDVCAKYGVWIEKSMYGKKYMGIQRSTFLISEDGILLKSWINVKVPGHVNEVLKAIKES